MGALIFLWLHNQGFYRALQKEVLEPIGLATSNESWADVGCSTGLLTRLAHQLNYKVIGFDINPFAITLARLLSITSKNISYTTQDFTTIDSKFDIVSATSLLSVVPNKKEVLNALIALLKDENSTLIIIEPIKKLSVKNTYKRIHTFKDFWKYKGLLLWAKAQENKEVDNALFDNLENVSIKQKYFLDSMISVRYIQKRQ